MANLEQKQSSTVVLIASIVVCCVPGLGQFLLGQTSKGLTALGLGWGLAILAIPCSAILIGFVFSIASIVVWVLAAVDAYAVAQALEAGEDVDENEYKNEFFFKVMSNLHKDAVFNG